MIDCYRCKKPKNCVGKEFYSYGEIRFCRTQMFWIIEHIGELGEGEWPNEGSSYVDLPITSNTFSDEAYFTKPEEIVAEVMGRLGRTGEDGVTLVEDIQSGIRRYEDLKSVAKRALNYISGLRRRKTSYSEWKSHRKGHNIDFPVVTVRRT